MKKRILPCIHCTPIEQAIQEHITMYNVSLPEHIVATLTTLFCLDDEFLNEPDDDLLAVMDPGVDGIQDVLQPAEA
jgi:hypothetical protein